VRLFYIDKGNVIPAVTPKGIIRWAMIMLVLLLAVFGLCACIAAPTPLPPEPTNTPLPPTSTPTPTIVWFPPTSTPTTFSTPLVTPTLDVKAGAGAILLSDDFSQGEAWNLSQTSTASIALGVNELTLALHQPKGYVYSLRREPLLDDFYLEITASPNLCRDGDEYGLLLRASPYTEFYRYSLSCDGQVRLDKYFQGKVYFPQPATLSGDVPPGAPSSSRLAVWAKGREMRFYINDRHQFTVSDGSLRAGSIGVFIRSDGENDLTVSFSDLVIREAQE